MVAAGAAGAMFSGFGVRRDIASSLTKTRWSLCRIGTRCRTGGSPSQSAWSGGGAHGADQRAGGAADGADHGALPRGPGSGAGVDVGLRQRVRGQLGIEVAAEPGDAALAGALLQGRRTGVARAGDPERG